MQATDSIPVFMVHNLVPKIIVVKISHTSEENYRTNVQNHLFQWYFNSASS